MMTGHAGKAWVMGVGLLCLFLMGCPPKQTKPGSDLYHQPQSVEIDRIGGQSRFPATAAGFNRTGSMAYTRSFDNYSVGYNIRQPSWSVTTTLYFYPRAVAFDDQFDYELQGLLQTHDQAQLVSHVLGTGTPYQGRQIKGRIAKLRYRQDYMGKRQMLDSYLIMYDINDRIVKVRSSAPQGQSERLLELTLDLLDEIT